MVRKALGLMLMAAILILPAMGGDDIFDKVEHKYADSDGVKIHYAALGKGPLVVFVHGFPDFWYSWRYQMAGLQDEFRVCAMDTRGYNMSDKPEKQEDYDMSKLVGDVAAVIKAEGKEKAVIVGHDWGGAIAWTFAMTMPQMTDKLIIVNLPHPKGIARELATNKVQQTNSAYARRFQEPDSHKGLSAAGLAGMLGKDETTKARYLEAFTNSSLNGMMCYYRQNYPKPPYEENVAELPKVSVPVLQFHGLLDTALNAKGLNNTWEYLDKDYTLVTIPGVNHWAHQEAHDLVTNTMKWWLKARQ